MDGNARRGKFLKRAIAVLLAVAAIGFAVFFLFRGALGSHAPSPLGNNGGFAVPRPDQPAGAPIDSVTLVENANAWNGRRITFTGEAIGELMVRGDMAWIHLNDDPYKDKNLEEGGERSGYNSGQAVWVTTSAARVVSSFGDYDRAGDLVAVSGFFHAACREHGGDMDLHADTLTVVRPGWPVAHPFQPVRLIAAVVLLLAAGGLFVLKRVTARK